MGQQGAGRSRAGEITMTHHLPLGEADPQSLALRCGRLLLAPAQGQGVKL